MIDFKVRDVVAVGALVPGSPEKTAQVLKIGQGSSRRGRRRDHIVQVKYLHSNTSAWIHESRILRIEP